jgi:thioredoxin-related protein
MRLASLLLLGLAVSLAVPAAAEYGPAQTSSALRWKKLDDAMDEAVRTRKPVFLMIGAKWCGYCHKMDAVTFRDPQVSRLLATRFSNAKMDGEGETMLRWPPKKAVSEAEIAYGMGIRGFPTLVFFRHDRRELARISSYLDPTQMKVLLDAILAYDASGALDKGIDFERWFQAHQGQ